MEPSLKCLRMGCFNMNSSKIVMNFSVPFPYNKTLVLQNNTSMETGAVIGFLVLAWWLLYLCVVVVSRQEAEWCCRIVTFVHGCLVTFLALQDLLLTESTLDSRYRTPLTNRQKNFLEISFSYFVFDITWMHIFGTETTLIWIHHLTSLTLIIKMVYSNIGGPAVSYGLAGLEGTNPYLQLRWYLRTHGYNNTQAHTIVELWFMFLFVMLRVFGGTWLIFWIEISPAFDLSCKIACIAVYGVSWLLVYQIVTYFQRKYLKGRRRSLSVYSIFPYGRKRRRVTTNSNS